MAITTEIDKKYKVIYFCLSGAEAIWFNNCEADIQANRDESTTEDQTHKEAEKATLSHFGLVAPVGWKGRILT